MKNETQLIKQLEEEGFTDIRVCPIPPNIDNPEHTHDQHTVHIILDGELTVTDKEGTKVYCPGERVDFLAGTVHKAKGSKEDGKMIVGIKK